MLEDKGKNNGPRHIGDILRVSKNARQQYAESPVAILVSDALEAYQQLRVRHSENTLSGIQTKLSAGTLFPQMMALRSDDPTRDAIADLLIDINKAYTLVKDLPNIKELLCEYILQPHRNERERFFARELLQKHGLVTGISDGVTNSATLLAEHLTTLEKPLKVASGSDVLLELAELTVEPALWLATLNNLIEGRVRGSNQEFVAARLGDNLEHVSGDPHVTAKLEELQTSTLGNAQRMYRIITGKASETQPPPTDEIDFDPFTA